MRERITSSEVIGLPDQDVLQFCHRGFPIARIHRKPRPFPGGIDQTRREIDRLTQLDHRAWRRVIPWGSAPGDLDNDGSLEVVVSNMGARPSLLKNFNPKKNWLLDSRLHFGLGDSAAYDRIEVEWPGGGRETFPGGKSNQIVTVTQGSGKPAPRP